jgi:hypothetical protein
MRHFEGFEGTIAFSPSPHKKFIFKAGIDFILGSSPHPPPPPGIISTTELILTRIDSVESMPRILKIPKIREQGRMEQGTARVHSTVIQWCFSLMQVYEMYVAGYTFQVLNNAFTYHWGFQVIF